MNAWRDERNSRLVENVPVINEKGRRRCERKEMNKIEMNNEKRKGKRKLPCRQGLVRLLSGQGFWVLRLLIIQSLLPNQTFLVLKAIFKYYILIIKKNFFI